MYCSSATKQNTQLSRTKEAEMLKKCVVQRLVRIQYGIVHQTKRGDFNLMGMATKCAHTLRKYGGEEDVTVPEVKNGSFWTKITFFHFRAHVNMVTTEADQMEATLGIDG